jgi:hypothetical protein
VDGHYSGRTSQNETFEFDVINGGRTFRGLKTGQVNQGCTPSFGLYGGNFNWPSYAVPISLSGDFTIDTDLTGGTIDHDSPSTGHLTIRGHITGQAGSGTFEEKTSFTYKNGVFYTCTSGLQTWTVIRQG